MSVPQISYLAKIKTGLLRAKTPSQRRRYALNISFCRCEARSAEAIQSELRLDCFGPRRPRKDGDVH
jgi:hypothetical protein